MNIICFPFERVIEINAFILSTEKGMIRCGGYWKAARCFGSRR